MLSNQYHWYNGNKLFRMEEWRRAFISVVSVTLTDDRWIVSNDTLCVQWTYSLSYLLTYDRWKTFDCSDFRPCCISDVLRLPVVWITLKNVCQCWNVCHRSYDISSYRREQQAILTNVSSVLCCWMGQWYTSHTSDWFWWKSLAIIAISARFLTAKITENLPF